MDLPGFVAAWLAEDPAVTAARARAREAGMSAATPEAGSLLRVLATMVDAKTVVETGTGTGVSGWWLLTGMRPDGVLTSIDSDPEQQRIARETFRAAGVSTARSRVIAGNALEVLPRLTDGGYDLVHLDASPAEYPGQYAQAGRLIRPGGIIVLSGVLRGGRVADPAADDPDSVALRELLAVIAADETVRPALLPIGDGMLVVAPSVP